jgi:hypothetical protein
MSVSNGRYAKVEVLGNTVAEMGQYTLSGFNRDVLEHTAFGTTVKQFVSGHVDGGEIALSGFYDVTDADGQRVLESACRLGRIFSPGDIKIYINDSYYFTVGTGGTMFVTKAGGVTMDKYGMAQTDFTIKVCGAALTLYPAASLSVSTSPSASPSNSPSKSFSLSPSASESPSISASESPSVSPS